jgi:hypothetical protein
VKIYGEGRLASNDNILHIHSMLVNRVYKHAQSGCVIFFVYSYATILLKRTSILRSTYIGFLVLYCTCISCWCNWRRVLNARVHTAFCTSIYTFGLRFKNPYNLESNCNNLNKIKRRQKSRAYYSVTKKTLWTIHSVSVLLYFQPSCLKTTLSINTGSI